MKERIQGGREGERKQKKRKEGKEERKEGGKEGRIGEEEGRENKVYFIGLSIQRNQSFIIGLIY